MELFEKTLDRHYIFKGKVVTLRVDNAAMPDGKTATREVIEHPGAVCIAPLTQDNALIFVRQFRYPFGRVVLELPAGKLEYGEDPRECAARELEEEAGVIAARYRSLGELLPSPAYCGEVIHLFAAAGLTATRQALDEDEFLELVTIPLDEAVDMVLDNRITDAKTQTAVLKLRLLLDREGPDAV